MSRIFEALKQAELVRSGKSETKPGMDAVEVPDRRRSRRWSIDIPVYVYGHGSGRETFHEEAHTLHISSNGALLLLNAPVRKGQKLLLTNTLNQKEQDCRVVFLGTRRTKTVEAGIAFLSPHPDFWHVSATAQSDTSF